MGDVLRFDGKVVIVTGAGGGLGRAHALAFGARGAKVVVNDLGGSAHGEGQSSSAADRVVEEIRAAGGEAVASYDSVEDGAKIVQKALDAFGRLDVVVNNAGILRDVSFHKMTDAEWDIVYRVHVRGSYAVTRAAWDHLREQEYGRIVMTASAAGIYGNFGQANYAMAKLGLVGFANTLAVEGRKRNVHVNTIAPIAGSRLTETVLPKEITDALKPEYVSPLVLWLCHEDCEETGGLFEVGGGYFGKLRWERARGKLYRVGRAISAEDVRSAWKEIGGFDESEHPSSINASMEPIMENLRRGPSRGGNEFIDVDEALGYQFPETRSSYSEKDLALYALGVGAAHDPLDEKELGLVYEMHGGGFRALPTFGVIPAINVIMEQAKRGTKAPGLNYGFDRILHGEQYTELKRPLPPSATPHAQGAHQGHLRQGQGRGRHHGDRQLRPGRRPPRAQRDHHVRAGRGRLGRRPRAERRGERPAGARARRRGRGEDPGEPGAPLSPERRLEPAPRRSELREGLRLRPADPARPLHLRLRGAPRDRRLRARRRSALLQEHQGALRQERLPRRHAGDRDVEGRRSTRRAPLQGEGVGRGRDQQRGRRALRGDPEEGGQAEGRRGEGRGACGGERPDQRGHLRRDRALPEVEPRHRQSGRARLPVPPERPESVWTVDVKSGDGSVSEGEAVKPDCTLEMTDQDFADMCTGKADAQKLYFGGKLKISGNLMASQKLSFLKKVTPEMVAEAMGARGGASAPAASAPAASAPQSADIFAAIAHHVSTHPELAGKVANVFLFKLTDPESEWTIDLKSPPGSVTRGAAAKPDCTLEISEQDFVDMASGKADAQKLYFGGKLKISGNVMASQKLSFLKDVDREAAKEAVAKARASASPASAPAAKAAREPAAPKLFGKLAQAADVLSALGAAKIQFRVTGPDAAWVVDPREGKVAPGEAGDAAATITIADEDLAALASGERAERLHQKGKLRVDGDVWAARNLDVLAKLGAS
ncbi:MAG: SDR family NAD(P)-dependent oxidoreductase [Sandaracinaceae bacterium]|nr:SDR family NAD(P)-dependent oxidoreductase [Sandaracinaceae bacterium]